MWLQGKIIKDMWHLLNYSLWKNVVTVLYIISNTPKYESMCVLSCFSHTGLFAIPLTVASQAPLSMGFSRQQQWSGFPYSPPGDLPNMEERTSLMSPALTSGYFTTSVTWEAQGQVHVVKIWGLLPISRSTCQFWEQVQCENWFYNYSQALRWPQAQV